MDANLTDRRVDWGRSATDHSAPCQAKDFWLFLLFLLVRRGQIHVLVASDLPVGVDKAFDKPPNG